MAKQHAAKDVPARPLAKGLEGGHARPREDSKSGVGRKGSAGVRGNRIDQPPRVLSAALYILLLERTFLTVARSSTCFARRPLALRVVVNVQQNVYRNRCTCRSRSRGVDGPQYRYSYHTTIHSAPPHRASPAYCTNPYCSNC